MKKAVIRDDQRGKGGKREGSGRKPDWLKQKCQSIIDRKKIMEYLGRVAAGEETEQQVVVVRDGKDSHTEIEEVKCSTRDRLHAIDMLLERGFGKAPQGLQLTGADGGPVSWTINVVGVSASA